MTHYQPRNYSLTAHWALSSILIWKLSLVFNAFKIFIYTIVKSKYFLKSTYSKIGFSLPSYQMKKILTNFAEKYQKQQRWLKAHRRTRCWSKRIAWDGKYGLTLWIGPVRRKLLASSRIRLLIFLSIPVIFIKEAWCEEIHQLHL